MESKGIFTVALSLLAAIATCGQTQAPPLPPCSRKRASAFASGQRRSRL